MTLQPADIILTRGRHIISRGIRVFTRTIGESRTKVNHVGIVIKEGTINDAIIVEALSTVKRHKIEDQYGDGNSEVAVYRPINLTKKQRTIVTKKAESYVGAKYGYLKILLHFLDWCLLGAYVFRRLGGSRYPICSWLVAHAYKAINKDFGVEVGQASPDDIWDFVTKEKKYKKIRDLKVLE